MRLPEHIRSIFLDTKGEVTGSRFLGDFKVKVVLSNSERLAEARLYKNFLPNDQSVSPRDRADAIVLSELAVKVIDGPDWWKESDSGKNMVDMEPLYALLVKIKEEGVKWSEEVQKLNEEALKG
jgi:hypothetical protein